MNSTLKHWTQLQYLPADGFFFGDYLTWWFNGFNFLMGIDDKVFAVGHYGGVWQYNTQANNWYRAGTFPEKMAKAPIVFAVNGKGYCIGDGRDNLNMYMNEGYLLRGGVSEHSLMKCSRQQTMPRQKDLISS